MLGGRHDRVHRSAVDVLAQDVGMAGVTGDLLHYVQ
jgi:hypothetical protein